MKKDVDSVAVTAMLSSIPLKGKVTAYKRVSAAFSGTMLFAEGCPTTLGRSGKLFISKP